MSGDNKGQTGPMGGQMAGGVKGLGRGQEEGCLPSILAADALGTHLD